MNQSDWKKYQSTRKALRELKLLTIKYYNNTVSSTDAILDNTNFSIENNIRTFRRTNLSREDYVNTAEQLYQKRRKTIRNLTISLIRRKNGFYLDEMLNIKQCKAAEFQVRYSNLSFTINADKNFFTLLEIPDCINLNTYSINLITHCELIDENVNNYNIDVYKCKVINIDNELFEKYVAINEENKFFAFSKNRNNVVKNVQGKMSRMIAKKLLGDDDG